jgi:hypothetical protein
LVSRSTLIMFVCVWLSSSGAALLISPAKSSRNFSPGVTVRLNRGHIVQKNFPASRISERTNGIVKAKPRGNREKASDTPIPQGASQFLAIFQHVRVADTREEAAEQRKNVAHGVSRGKGRTPPQAPAGAAESAGDVMTSAAPPGLGFLFHIHPQLTLWATICRASGAEADIVSDLGCKKVRCARLEGAATFRLAACHLTRGPPQPSHVREAPKPIHIHRPGRDLYSACLISSVWNQMEN